MSGPPGNGQPGAISACRTRLERRNVGRDLGRDPGPCRRIAGVGMDQAAALVRDGRGIALAAVAEPAHRSAGCGGTNGHQLDDRRAAEHRQSHPGAARRRQRTGTRSDQRRGLGDRRRPSPRHRHGQHQHRAHVLRRRTRRHAMADVRPPPSPPPRQPMATATCTSSWPSACTRSRRGQPPSSGSFVRPSSRSSSRVRHRVGDLLRPAPDDRGRPVGVAFFSRGHPVTASSVRRDISPYVPFRKF